jgi:ribosomal protein S18 acetylase RimI-like enzyme
MDKETLKKVLAEFIATVNSNTSKTEDEILSKFPELKGYDKSVLAEFVATVNSNTSKTEDEILSKFPEFTANMAKPINEPQKKKIGTTAMESSLGGGLLESTGIEQPVAEQPVKSVTETVAPILGAISPQVQAPLLPQTNVEQYFQQEKEKEKEWAKKEADVYEKKFIEGNKEFEDEYGYPLSGPRDLSSIPQPVLEELKNRATDAWQGIKYAEELDKRMKAEREKDFKLSNQAALRNPELAQLLNVIDDNYIQKTEEDAVGELNQKFSKYGLHFAQSGAGNYVTVRTSDGLNEMEFKFGDRKREYSNYNDAYPDISSNRAALKRFIVENARNPEEVEIKNEDYITKALKARELRRVPMISENGEQSTVMFTSIEADGKNYVIPTLFPKNPTSYTSNPKDWMEILDEEDAFAEAKKRGEVFEFDNKEDAQRFADGEWKDIGIHDLEGKKFYEERGLDYMAEKRKWDEYNKVQDELDVINAIKNGDYSSIPPAERMRYPHLFGADGRPLYFLGIGQTFINKRTDELTKRRDSYIEQTYDEAFDGMYNMGLSSKSDSGPVQKTREEFDLFLEKRRKEEITKAVDNNLKAKEQYSVINKLALDSFGVPLEEISKVTPKDEKEAQVLDQINREKVRIDYTKNVAALNYENANIYYDRKWNKKVHGEYTENLAGAYNSLINGLNNGSGADAMWWTALGINNIEDQGSREELIKKIVEIETQKQNAEESLTWSRYTLGREGTGVKTFLSDPFEFMTSITVGSLAQMLPLGVKIIPATVVGGTAIGGLTGGIPGAVKGFGQGLSIGQSATNFALEYGNAIYDVMYRKGYDLTDPKQVEAALMDDTVWSEGFERGVQRGVPIAIADYLGSRLAGRVFNVSKTASMPLRAAALGAERLIVDPAVEMIGEYSAQVATGDDVDMSEVYLEGLGGFGMQAPSMSVKLYGDVVNNEMTAHAYNLTDINNLAMEGTSDERITSWVSNMKRLGKIDDDVSQRVLENVGLRREARELLGTGAGVLGMKSTATREVESRVMQLLAAKKEMTSTDSRKSIFGEKINAVNNELAKIAETGKMVPESERSNFEVFSAFTQREGVSNYKVNGRTLTKNQFDTWMENATQKRLLKSRIQVLNDEDTKQKYEEKVNAILKQKAGQVLVLTEAGISQEVEGRTPEAELEDIAGEGVQAEETLTEAAPEQNETEAIKQDVVSSKTLLEQLNDSIPQPLSQIGKSVTERFQQGKMDEQETQSLLSALAERVNGKKRLTAEQQAVYDANKKRVDELSGLISQRNDLNTEVSELESILESRKATETGKPKTAPDFTIDENVDADSANQVREIASKRKLGIPKNREVAFVARDKNGNVIGGAFRSLDKKTNKYSFDVAVSEEAEGRGVGSSLLDSVRNVPFEMRSTAPGATVEVDVVNPAMQQMLRRRGYVVTKRLGGDRVLMAPRKVKKAKVSSKTPEVVSAKNQAAVNELSSRSSRSRRDIIAQATRAVTVLSKILPDLEIFIHETREEYNDTVSKLDGRENSAGNFAIIGRGPNQKRRIDINLSVANENTVAHEVAHAVMMKAFGEDVKLFKSFRNQISKILDSTTNEELNEFAARYSEAESHEEFLVELAAVLSNNAQSLEQSLVQKIANAINGIVSKITGGRFVPFSGAANAMQIIDFMNTFAPAMAEGSTIDILNTQNPYSTGIAIRVDPNTFTQTRTRSKSSIGLYKFESELEVLKFVKLPTYSLKQIIQKYGGRVAIITSDATGYGLDSEGNPILGGFGYAQNKQNVEDGIGYASVNSSTASGTYTAARNEFGDNQKVLVLIMVQPPWTTINNSYGANYFFRGLLELANTSPEEFAKTKESMLEWIDSSDAMKKFVTTPELIKVIKSINIDGIKSKEELNAYREKLTNKLLELTTFDVRKIFMKGVLFDLNTTGSSKKTTYSKIALRNIGYTIQNFLSEYGDNTTLTDEMYLNDEGGYVVGGFEINTMTKETANEFIESMQSKGITHPLFNGKLPGTNHFVLDGLYSVQDNFGRFAAPNWEVDNSKISEEEVNSLVRKYYSDDSFYVKESLNIPLEDRGYSELKLGTKTKFKETYMRPLGFLMPVQKKVDVDVARGLGFKLKKGITPEQIAQAEFTARSKSQLPVAKTANALKDVSDTLTYSYGKNQERYAAYRNAGLIWHAGNSVIRQFDESKIKGGARGVLGYGYYFADSSKPFDYGTEITFLNAKDLNFIDGDMPPSTDLVNKINNFIKEAKDARVAYYAELMIREHNNKPDKSIDEIRKTVQWKFIYDTAEFYSTILKEVGVDGVQVSNNWQIVLFPNEKLDDLLVDPNIFTSEEYHKAKADNSNPKLVKSVEDLIGVPEGQDVVSKSQLPVDEQVKSMSSLLPDELQTMQTIISTGRNNGFSDAAIVEFLKKKGFNVSDIMPQMQLNVDLFTVLPVEFSNIEGGSTKGMQLFADIRYELSKWVAAQKRTPTNIQFRQQAQNILKNHPIFKKQSDSTKMSLQVSFDRSLNKKSDGQIQRRMDNLVNNLKQRKLAEKEFQQAKAKLANIIRSLLPSNEKIDVDVLNKILNVLSKSTANTIIKDIDTIVPLIEKQRQSIANRLVKDIKKIISDRAKTQKTKSGKRRAKGIDEVGQAFFRAALDVIKDILQKDDTKISERSQKYEDAAIDGTLAELYRKQENGEDLTSQEQELLDEVTAFDLLRDINLMDIEQLNEVMNVLQTLNKEAIKSLKIKRLERSATFDALKASANNQLKQMFPILFDANGNPIGKNQLVQMKREIRNLFNKLKIWDGAKKAYAMFSISEPSKISGFLRANIDHLGTVCNSLDNAPLGLNFFTENIYRPLNRSIERMLRGEFIVEEYLDAMANSITGVKKGRKEIETRLYSMGAVKLKTKSGLFNADELLRIYALSLNDIQRDKLNKMGWTNDVIKEIKTELGPEVIEYADMVVEYLSNDYYESVNNVYRYVFNTNLNRISNYFPTKTIRTKVDGKMLEDGDFNAIFAADHASALKERTDTKGEIDLYMGFTVALENHYKSMERFKAYAKTTQDINSIFKNESVIMLLNESGYMKLIRNHINYAINPDSYKSSGSTDDRAVSWLIRRFVGVALGLKVWQASKQAVSSFGNAYEKYSYFPSDSKTPNIVKKSLDLPAFMVDSAIVIAQFRKWYNEAYEKSATFRNRAENSLSGDIAGIESGGNLYVVPENKRTGIIARAKRKFRSAKGFFTAVGDLAGVLGYMVNYRRNIINGMDTEDAIEIFNEYNQMQQSDRPTEKTPLQQSTFWMSRMMTLFGSSTYLMINNVFQSWGNIAKSIKAKKMPRSVDMRRFALAYGASHALFVLISNLFALTKGDEEDKKRVLGEAGRALLGAENLKTIPWFGTGYELVENKMLGIDRPVSQLNDPLLSTATKITKGISAGSVWQSTKPIAEIVLGVSTDPIIGLNRMFSEGIDEDAMYDIIGISKSYRPGYGQKEKKEEDIEGVSKEDLKRFYPELYEEKYKKKQEFESEYESYNKMVEEDMKQYREAMYGSE